MTVKFIVMACAITLSMFFFEMGYADQSQPSAPAVSNPSNNDQVSNRQAIIDIALNSVEDQLNESGQNNANDAPPAATTPPAAPTLWQKFNIHGDVETLVARQLYNPDRFSELLNQVTLDSSGAINDSLHYRVSGWVNYDSVYDLGYYPKDVERDQVTEAELRDTYLDYSLGPWDIRLGKQQIVWGESAGVFVADVVNAQDLRQFLLPDFDQIRIPEWGTDLEYTHEDFHSEFVFIPVPDFNKLGLPGSEFPYPYPVPPGTPYTISDDKKPDYGFENAKYGTRLSYLIDGVDVGAFYLHSWTEDPVFYRTIDDSTGTFEFTPAYKRLDTLGGTFSGEVADTVLKGEMAFNINNYFSESNPLTDGISRSDSMQYALGADHTFWEKNIVGVQFIQYDILNYNNSFINERSVNNYASLSWQRDFLNHKMTAEFFTIAGLESPDFMYRPDIKYNFTDNWQIKLGLDIFAGHPDGLFSEYRNSSRYYCESDLKF